ncbi:TPA: LicD family protein [Proteus mirabilis]|nr:LicD family protein [Proteus mirabilis]
MNKYDLRKKQLKMLKGLIEIHRICQLHNINYWLDAGTLLGAVRHSGFIPWDDDIDICMFRDDYNKFINIAKYELNTNDFFLQTVTTDKDYIFINIPCKLRINNTEIVEKFEKIHNCYNEKSHHGLFVDIFPYDKYSENKNKRKIQRLLSIAYKIKKLSYCNNIGAIKYILSRIFSIILPIIILEKTKNIIANKMNKEPNNSLYGAGIETPFTRAYFSEDEIFPLKKNFFEGYEFNCPNNTKIYLEKMFGPNYMTPPPEEERYNHS